MRAHTSHDDTYQMLVEGDVDAKSAVQVIIRHGMETRSAGRAISLPVEASHRSFHISPSLSALLWPRRAAAAVSRDGSRSAAQPRENPTQIG